MYVIVCANLITVLEHMSDGSLLRCKTYGTLWEHNGNSGENLVQEIKETTI